MERFVWKDSFNIGVAEIDEQHKLFLEYVNECQNASCSNSRSQVTGATIWDLKTYAATHFRFEEELMKEAGYPDLAKHMQLHAYFESRVEELEKAHARGSKNTVESLLHFLQDWFLRHILEHDKKLALFCRSQRPGVKKKVASSQIP